MDTFDREGAIRWIPCLNTEAEAVPPFGIVRVTTTDSDQVLSVAKPNANSQDCYVVGPEGIAANGIGYCTWDSPITALYENGTPAEGEEWGSISGSYKLNPKRAGWKIKGDLDTTNTLVYARRSTTRLSLHQSNSSVTITGTENNYVIPNANILLVTAAADRTITGFADGYLGRWFELVVDHASTGAFTIPHLSASSSAANRVFNAGKDDIQLQPGEAALLKHDGTYWLVAERPSLTAQRGTTTPSHSAPNGTYYYNSTSGLMYLRTFGVWTTVGFSYDMLGNVVYIRNAITGAGSISSIGYAQWHTFGGSGPYTVNLPAAVEYQHFGMYALSSLTGVVTVDANSTEEIQGPGGSGAATQTIKLVANEHLVIQAASSNFRTMMSTLAVFSFQVTKSDGGSIASGGTKVEFNGTPTMDRGGGGCYDNATNYRYTPKAPGIYLFNARVTLVTPTAGLLIKLYLYKNGSLAHVLDAQTVPSGGNDFMLTGSVKLSMNGEGDYVEIFVDHSDFGSLNTVSNAAWNTFEGTRLSREES